MRIGIDARWIIKEASGIGQYTLNLLRHLALHDQVNQYFVFYYEKKVFEKVFTLLNLSQFHNFTSVHVPWSVFSVLGQILLPLKLKKLKIDIFHSTNFMVPLLSFGIKRIITVHDLIPFLFPEFAPKSKKSRFYRVYRFLMHWIIRGVDHILVDSQHSYQDLVSSFPKAKAKSSVLVFGVDPIFEKPLNPSSQGVRRRLGIENAILLYVGRQDPYKNILGLLKIFKSLLERMDHLTLVLTGPEDQRYPEIRQCIKQFNLDSKVVMTGFLSQEELVELYHEASVLILPSLYEGFGLPVLEAFACGVPVVASRVASLPEVVQDSGLLLDPMKTDEWVVEIERILKDEVLRDQLIQKGYKRLKDFSWHKAAENLIKLYHGMHHR